MIGGAPSVQLARRADEAVFGPFDLSPEAIDTYWDHMRTARSELRSNLSLWGKLRATLSLTSLRSGTK